MTTMGEEEMNTELVCVMASLGYHDEDDYYMGQDCIESLKDLVRFLRKVMFTQHNTTQHNTPLLLLSSEDNLMINTLNLGRLSMFLIPGSIGSCGVGLYEARDTHYVHQVYSGSISVL